MTDVYTGTLIGPHGERVGRYVSLEDHINETQRIREKIAGRNYDQALEAHAREIHPGVPLVNSAKAPEPMAAPSFAEAYRRQSETKQGGMDALNPPTTPHTVEEDFQHYLSYSGLRGQNEAVLRQAYYAGAGVVEDLPSQAAVIHDNGDAYK